jgi:DNA invertase Pin-like site-specific DNA recombinase
MQREGWQLVDRRYDDVGHSSETLDRPALNRLVEDIHAGVIDRVLVHRLDRVARKILYACQFLELLRQFDVAITIVSQPELTGDASGRLLINLMATFAEFEQEMTKSRMADARAALKAHGRRVAGRVPYGYFADPATKQLIISKSEATDIQKIFELAANGKSLAEIAEFFNEPQGIPAKFESLSSPWTPRRISAVLSNRHYIGQIKYGNAWVKGLHEPIVEEQMFKLSREQTAGRRTTSKTDRSVSSIPNSLRGLVDCPKCSRKLSIGTDVKKIDRLCKKVTTHYRCRSNAGGKRPCTAVRIQAWKLEKRVIDAITAAASNSVTIDRVELTVTDLNKLSHYWALLNSSQRDKLLPLIIASVIPSEDFNELAIQLKPDALDYVRCMAAYGQPKPPASKSSPSRSSRKRRKPMIASSASNRAPVPLRERLKRVQRLELFYDDLNSTPMLMRRCEISNLDIPELINVVAEDLLDCDPTNLDELQTLPDSDGNETNWHNNYLLATPSDSWIASIVATRALIELKAEEAIAVFVELLFENWRFPRLSVGIEAQYFFAPLGEIAIDPLCEAFELSGPEDDEGRRDVVAALGFIGAKHPNSQAEITNRIVNWLNQHKQQNTISNSEIVCVLLDFKASQMADSIRSALDAKCIDTGVCGDWDEIRAELSARK